MHPASTSLGHYIGRAVGLNVISKATGLGLQLIVLPFAFRQLGPERFGVYGVFVGIISLFTLLDAGMGPVLTRRIAVDIGSGKKTSSAASVGVLLALLLGIGCLLIGVVLVALGAVDWVYGSHHVSLEEDIHLTSYVAVVLLALQPWQSLGSRVAAGTARLDEYSRWSATGNGLAGIFVFAALWLQSSPAILLLALNGTQLLVRGAATTVLLKTITPHVDGFGDYLRDLMAHGPLLREMLFDSGVFVFINGSPLLLRETVRWALIRHASAADVGVYSLLMQMALVALSVLAMATSALWPLLASHKANDKNEDAAKVLKWCNASALICSIGVGISLLVSLSSNAASWLLGLEVPWLLQLVFASYLVGSFWEHTQLLPFYAAGNWRWPLILYTGAIVVLVSITFCFPQYITLYTAFIALLGLSLITTILLKLGANRSDHFGATGV